MGTSSGRVIRLLTGAVICRFSPRFLYSSILQMQSCAERWKSISCHDEAEVVVVVGVVGVDEPVDQRFVEDRPVRVLSG